MNAAKDRLYQAYVRSGQAPALATIAPDGDELFRLNRPYIDKVIRPLLPPQPDARIVDLGCGNGCYLYHAKQYGYTNLIGVDTSAEQVALAHQIGLTDVRQQTIDSFLATYHDPTDLVLLMDVLEHLTLAETLVLLDAVYAVLKPGGRVLIHVPNAEGIFGMRIRYGDLTHEQCFTPNSMRQLLQTVGFSRLVCYEDKPVVFGLVSLLRWVIWELTTLRYRLMLLAETATRGAILSQNMLVVATR
ncbi:class I SAM-dependent methyltransferase [Fibrella sp. WM1]|uniref:class I SAM-dependent methyltransferase n=1 Tax=Fibrella musci TaxID=3242485 RepID=UPI0035203F0C